MDFDRIIMSVNFDEYRCLICASFLESPVVDTCNHTYCRLCISLWLQNSNFCPISRQLLLPSNLRKLKLVDKIMNGLVVCKNTFKGCKWTGSSAEYEFHSESCEADSSEEFTPPCFEVPFYPDKGIYSKIKYVHESYEGYVYLGTRQGKGKLSYLNGDSFEGSFYRNLKQGPGKYYFKLGCVFHGEWKDGFVTDGGYLIDENGAKHAFDSPKGNHAWMRVYSNDARTLNLK